MLPIARMGLNEPLQIAAVILLGLCAFLAIVVLGMLSSTGNFARMARRLSGDLGATFYGSNDTSAPLRQAVLHALASEGAFDSQRVTQRRWRRSLERVPRPMPAVVAERFVRSIRMPTVATEGRVNPVIGSMATVASVLVAGAGAIVFAVLISVFGTGSPVAFIVVQFMIVPLAALVVIGGVIMSLCGGAQWVRRIAGSLGGWVEITPDGIRDRRGRMWSPRDSMLLVQPMSDSGQSAVVRLIGPAGPNRIRIGAASSQEVARLLDAWSRWIEAMRSDAVEAPGSAPTLTAAAEDGAPPRIAAASIACESAEPQEMEEWLAGGVGARRLAEEVPAAVAPGTWRDGDDDAEVPTVALPLLRPLGSWPLLRDMGVLIVVQTSILVVILLLNPAILIMTVAACFPVVVLSTPLIVAGVRFVRAERDRLAAQSAAKRIIADPLTNAPSRALAQCLIGRPTFISAKAEGQRWLEAIASMTPTPRALVAPGMALQVRSLGRTERFLEPHEIEPGSLGSHLLGGVVANAVVAGFFLALGLRWIGAIMAFVALVTLLRVPFIWYRLPISRSGRKSLLAGPGWLRDPKGRIWTIRDSTILVVPAAEQGGVMVRLIGPAGVRDVRFGSAADPEFTALWRLWTHRDPRPELAPAP